MMPILLAADASTPSDKPDAGKPKAMLDPSSIQGQDQSRSDQKVELDLDDAPFLEEPEEEEEAPQEFFAEAQAEELAIAPAKPENFLLKLLKDKKLRLLLLALLLLALLALTTVKFILPVIELKETEKAEIKPAPEEVEESAPPPPPAEPEIQEFVLGLAPFWIEKMDAKGQVHFLHLKFAFTSLSPALENEVKIKSLLLRDAIYYYLKNKDFEFLADTKNIEALKADLVSVLNQYLGNDQLDTIYVEKYLVQ